MIVVLAAVSVVGLLLARRRRRAATLAGLNGERPVFHVDPPSRRLLAGRRDTL